MQKLSSGKEPFHLSMQETQKIMGLIPGSGGSPGRGNDNPFQHPCLDNPWTEEPGGLQSRKLQRAGYD